MSQLRIALLILVLLTAFFLRFYQLGQNPPSLDWDEASLGWNAYSILKTGSDEYGKRLPVAIRSFNDYKPALYVYSLLPSLAIFGLNEWSVRLPSATAGFLTVICTYFLVLELLQMNKEGKVSAREWWVALLTTFLLAISPWHIQFSRVAFEANLALFLFVGGALFLARFLRKGSGILLFLSILGFSLSVYSYHSPKLVVPVFVLGIVLYYRQFFIRRIREVVVGAFLVGLLLSPLVITTIRGNGSQVRFGTVSIFSDIGFQGIANETLSVAKRKADIDRDSGDVSGRVLHNRFVTFTGLIAKGYLDHFNFGFLFLNGDGNGRHHAPDTGLLYLWELPFILLGLYYLFTDRPKWLFFIVWWFLSAPLAASLATDTPHAVRSLLYLPTYQIFAAYGFVRFWRWLEGTFLVQRRREVVLPILIVMVAALALNCLFFLHQYFVHMPTEFASSWQYGYKEMVSWVSRNEARYKNVYVTVAYDQPYIYFLFYGNTDPSIKNPGNFSEQMGKLHFVNFSILSEKEKAGFEKSSLLVLAPTDSVPNLKLLTKIYYPDGTEAFRLAQPE